MLKKVADGEVIALNEDLYDPEIFEDLAELLNDSVLMLLPSEETE